MKPRHEWGTWRDEWGTQQPDALVQEKSGRPKFT
jgi:hypothetical protein